MPAPTTPPSAGGTSTGQRAAYANPAMRVSDAERTEVADRLSKHYGDGRLDQEEFDKRLHQAMSAVTQADLAGLFADLPGEDAPAAEPPGASQPGTSAAGAVPPGAAPPTPAARGRRSRPPIIRILALALVIVIAAGVGNAVAHLFFPWVLIAVVVVLCLRYGPGQRRR